MTAKNIIAAFDFDCTMTTRDTLLPFLCQTASPLQSVIKFTQLLPTALGYKAGWIENHPAKEKVLTTFLQNYNYTTLLEKAQHFAETAIPPLIKPEALQRLRWHQTQGHRCMLISAGLEIYLAPLLKTLALDEIIATRLVVINNKVSGHIEGLNCFGEEKVSRLLKTAGPKENFILYAYGDSRGDKELLALADYAFYRHMPA